MIDPRIAHTIPTHVLLGSLRGVDQTLLFEIRHEFARWLTAPAHRTYGTWQEAWNVFVGADHGGGRFAFTPNKCTTCKGKGYDHRNAARNFARTGNAMMCGECRGTRRGRRMTFMSIPLAVPETAPMAPDSPTETENEA